MNEKQKLDELYAEIALCEVYADRPKGDVCLLAVSKTYEKEQIEPYLMLGHQNFGENRVQESLGKWPDLLEKYPQTRLHLIGPLQSNKAAQAVKLFDSIHTLDRVSLVDEIANQEQKQGKVLQKFIQVNVGDEAQKAGVALSELEALFVYATQKSALDICGFMCIPPFENNPSPYFALLAKLAKEFGLPCLSMGMSADFRQAITLGATHIRVGSVLFGKRV